MSGRPRPPAAARRFFDAVIRDPDLGAALRCGRLLSGQGLKVLICERDDALAPARPGRRRGEVGR